MADPDFITGARVGTATGGQLEVDESSVGRRSPEPGYNQGIYRGGVPNGIYGECVFAVSCFVKALN